MIATAQRTALPPMSADGRRLSQATWVETNPEQTSNLTKTAWEAYGQEEISGASIPDRGNSDRTIKFRRLIETIRRMAKLPEGHDFHLHGETAQLAEDILGFWWQNYLVDPPKVFPQEQETLVFTWDSNLLKRYVAIDPEVLDLSEINRKTGIRCDHELNFQDQSYFLNWLRALGGVSTSRTTTNSDVGI